ncbi:MAG TPA: efflux transporter periplasmic adaptor subunit, partial [Burkholderiaceae bacterium]|nr:efflux transporter periplasmic adaptor subunit [Burkholderiaceae bacterium]
MKITRSRIVVGLAVVAALAVTVWAFAPRPIEVEVAHVTQGHFESAVEEDGKTRLRDRYVVAAPLTGVLSRVTLREGDEVEAGAVVATLQPVLPPLQDQRTLRELRARLTTVRAVADRAQAQVGAAEVELARAQNELKRSEQLASGGFISENKRDLDQLG